MLGEGPPRSLKMSTLYLPIKFTMLNTMLLTVVGRPHIKDIFQSIAAKVGTGEPCCDWVSTSSPPWPSPFGLVLS